jgi:hypothetical protein
MKHLLGMGLLASSAAVAQIRLPPEVSRFVEPGTVAIAVEKGDVNGDGQQDYLLVWSTFETLETSSLTTFASC